MLFHYLSGEHPGVDVQQIVCTLREELDPERFGRAWQRVTDRHDVLRGFLRWEGVAEPVMQVAPTARPAFVVHGWSRFSAADQEERFEAFLRKDRRWPVTLDRAPLFRLSVFCFDVEQYRFVLTFHHLMMDGRSTANSLREVMDVYRWRADAL